MPLFLSCSCLLSLDPWLLHLRVSRTLHPHTILATPSSPLPLLSSPQVHGIRTLEPLHPFQEEHEVAHGHLAHIALFSPYAGVSMLMQWGDGLNERVPHLSSAASASSGVSSASASNHHHSSHTHANANANTKDKLEVEDDDEARPRPLQLQLFPSLRAGLTRVPLTVTAAECAVACEVLVLLHIPPQVKRAVEGEAWGGRGVVGGTKMGNQGTDWKGRGD